MARDQRRLAAIVSADVAGYSRLMGRDESGTLAALKAHLRELIDPKIAEYGGRVVKRTGDGLLLEFASVVEAVLCAVEVQDRMAERNAGAPVDQRIDFRMGINVGDIIVDGDDIFGDGVNVAARLEALAIAGGICVSGIVRDQVLDKVNLSFAPMGAQKVKNIARPIEVFRVALHEEALGSPASKAVGTGIEANPAPPSIAVLPFVNRGRDEEDEYFADGLADELLNVLAKIRGLRVAARSSSFSFKGKNATVAEVGRVLNVATVLEGSVRKAGNRLRISVQLVQVADGYGLWSESYDRTLEDIFAVQDDIAESVVKELRTALLGETADRGAEEAAAAAVASAVKGRATNAEAHRLYLQARHFFDQGTHEGAAKAIAYLKQALTLEPAFALAWAELGRAYTLQATIGWAPVGEGFAAAREATVQALALEPELAEAHSVMGVIQMNHDWDWPGAEASLRRAAELAPGNAVVLDRVGNLAFCLSRLDEAIELKNRALAQDPLSARSYYWLGSILEAAGRLADAEAAFRKALEIAPQIAATRASLSLNLLAQGRGEEALAEAKREPDEAFRLRATPIIHHVAGRATESTADLQELIAKYAMDSAYQVAGVYAARGEADFAFQWLNRARAQRDTGLVFMKVDPLLRSLHADARWDPFLREMGLAD